jgi:hypothetical protein
MLSHPKERAKGLKIAEQGLPLGGHKTCRVKFGGKTQSVHIDIEKLKSSNGENISIISFRFTRSQQNGHICGAPSF